MNFSVGDILFFKEYTFTDTGKTVSHFGLVLLPEYATKYKNSLLCCVITSNQPRNKRWALALKCSCYSCFTRDSFACFDRKDLVSKNGLGRDHQPKAKLSDEDSKKAFKILKKSLFVIRDLANNPFMRGAIIYEWKKALKLV